MKKVHLLALLLASTAAAFALGCKQEPYAVKGTIANAANLQVALEQSYFQGQPIALAKATCDGSGAFKIEQKEPLKAGVYRLTIGAKRMFMVLDGKESGLDIAADLNTMDKMSGVEIKGSETAQCFVRLNQELASLSQSGPLTPEKFKEVCDKGCTPLMKTVMMLQLLNGPSAGDFLPEFKKMSEQLNAEMPGSKYATDLVAVIGQVEQFVQRQQGGGDAAAAGPIKVGQEAPEISLPDPNGKVRSLKSLRGKVVLLDFWASWCGPCRRENPNVVAAYKKYKAKGFEIFSVSLDGVDTRNGAPATPEAEARGREAWKQAIAADGLTWEYHVSDLRKWGSAAAALYGVQSIPAQFLIGKDGKIVSTNTRGKLEAEIEKAL